MFNFNNDNESPMAPVAGAAVAQQAQGGGDTFWGSNAPGTDGGMFGGTGFLGLGKTGQGVGFLGPNGAANLKLGMGAVQALGGMWNSYNQNKMAKQALALQTRAFETNLANQTQTYNTGLEDRIRSRYAAEGRGQGETQAYLDKHKL